MGVLVSLDVFGIMAWQRQVDLSHTGQDIVKMAKHCDVISPMIYPSHFFGMDGYAAPGDAPEHFISVSMDRFDKITAGSGVVLRPWLQAFRWRTKTYSPEYILKQVSASKESPRERIPVLERRQRLFQAICRHAHHDGEPEDVPVHASNCCGAEQPRPNWSGQAGTGEGSSGVRQQPALSRAAETYRLNICNYIRLEISRMFNVSRGKFRQI